MSAWLFAAALRLVPASWRASVRADIEEDARAQRRGGLWKAWQAARVAFRWRSSFAGGAMLTDLKYVVRGLMHSKGFTLAAMLTLVLGLGVNVAVFTVVDRMLFRPMPFAHADRLVMVTPYDAARGQRYSRFPKRLFVEGRRSVTGIEDMGFAGFTSPYAMGPERDAPSLSLTAVSYNVLDVLGAAPAAGRSFLREDAEQKRAVAMITDETWQARFGRSPSAIGLSLRQDRKAAVIIGVLPEGFIAPVMNRSVRFDGLILASDLLETAGPKDAVDPGIARLAPGVSIRLAQQQFDATAARLDAEVTEPGQRRGDRVLLEPLREAMFWRAHTYLWLVTLAASLVGLLACANFSSLLLARGRSREGDVALRASLGASRGRLVATEVAQSLVVCLLAAGVSLGVLAWTGEALRALVPAELRLLVLGGVDARVVLFACLAAVLAAVMSTAIPAWRASRTPLLEVLQRSGGPGRTRSRRAGSAVLAIEAAVGVVLITGAAGVVRSFVGLATTDVGFETAGVHVVRIEPTGERGGGDNAAELARYRTILAEIRRHTGVIIAGAVDSMPSQGATAMTGLKFPSGVSMGLWQVTDGFLPAIGARVLAGRDITALDVDTSQPVAIVTRAAAAKLWPDEPLAAVVGRPLVATGAPVRQVVGVIDDVRDRPDQAPQPKVIAAVLPEPFFWYLEFAVKTDPDRFNPDALRKDLAARMGATWVAIEPAGRGVRSALEQPRTQAVIFSAFAIVGLILGGLGLFAVASFDVALRRPEMGLRLALGATASGLRRLVILGALRPVAIGVAVGLVAAYWAATFAQTLVYETNVRDPWTLVAVAGVLLASAVVAAWLPARRASRVDPVTVLRAQ